MQPESGNSAPHSGTSQHRIVAQTWLDTKPFGDLLLMCVLMEPQRMYMQRMLTRGGCAFEQARAWRAIGRHGRSPTSCSDSSVPQQPNVPPPAASTHGEGAPVVGQRDETREPDMNTEDYRVLSAAMQVYEKEF